MVISCHTVLRGDGFLVGSNYNFLLVPTILYEDGFLVGSTSIFWLFLAILRVDGFLVDSNSIFGYFLPYFVWMVFWLVLTVFLVISYHSPCGWFSGWLD